MNLNDNKNEFEIMGTGSMAYQARYPLAQAPGSEFQGMNYKDWMNRCADGEVGELFADPNAVRNAVVMGAKVTATIIGIAFPPLKVPAQVLSMLIPIWWPEQAGPPGTSEAQFTWKQWMSATEEMMDQKIDTLVKERAIESLQVLQDAIRAYQQAICNLRTDPDNEKYKEDVRREFNDAEDQARAVIIQLRNPKYAILLLADYAQAANLHLLLLRDVVQFGESWGFSALEVQQYYFNNQVGNPGLKQLLATYTDHCVSWYNEGLTKRYETGNWNTFNDFRRNMTLMAMDIVSFWPTYDPILYKVPTKSQLTRIVYTPLVGKTSGYAGVPASTIAEIELNTTNQFPRLFAWLRELSIYKTKSNLELKYCGFQQSFQNTMVNEIWSEPFKGNQSVDRQTLTIPSPEFNDDVWRIATTYYPYMGDYFTINGWQFSFTKGPDKSLYDYSPSRQVLSGLPCGGSSPSPCDPCNSVDPCSFETLNPALPCDDKALYSHRFAYMGAAIVQAQSNIGPLPVLPYSSYGWTHVSADENNLIDAERITQIPAVKGSVIRGNTQVVRGNGSTGGDWVSMGAEQDFNWDLTLSVTFPLNITQSYRIRLRYACASQSTLDYYGDGGTNGPSLPGATGSTINATYSSNNPLTYNSFGYVELDNLVSTYNWMTNPNLTIRLDSTGDSPLIIDKIEFIPIEGSVEEYEANLALEKARKAVNALFTNDAKNALQLNVTDYAVDQAANLAECVSDECHAQEKMILLDQVKFAKRLSHARNLLNHGDFESSDWAGENGWK
ncbi:insecticidal delta-endotoxin Cry8Ea1 family protein, partial [Bacillus mycoides]|uniref:insecticidal delta-endotoxin Cry8Ea1 family protein n=1 Tax=Bacillus mycoides TaxID=1405 RepID=UPI003D65D518